MDKFSSMLGLCRRAGKLAVGRDAVLAAVRKKQTDVVFLTADASPRHARELRAVSPDLSITALSLPMEAFAPVLGKKSCLFAPLDPNFSSALLKLSSEIIFEEPNDITE